MSSPSKKGLIPIAWLFYLLIVFEIIYMISPFALYYYSAYGPSLNFLHQSPFTAWISGFFLPHFSESSSWIFNHLGDFGRFLFLGGLIFFLIAAFQIYYAKFAKKGAVTGGFYKSIRHPQYTAFSIMGFGVLLVWPRFLVLIGYVIMLFAYYFLARKEEAECEEKFGETYRDYLQHTGRFWPKHRFLDDHFSHRRIFSKRTPRPVVHILAALFAALLLAFWVRSIAIDSISTVYEKDSATVSVAKINTETMENIIHLASSQPEVQEKLAAAGYGDGEILLNYIVPREWILADLPLEEIPDSLRGHYHPRPFNENQYKILFTRAKLFNNGNVVDADIIKRTFAREALVVVQLDIKEKRILSIDTPPAHVLWGDIPTPLF